MSVPVYEFAALSISRPAVGLLVIELEPMRTFVLVDPPPKLPIRIPRAAPASMTFSLIYRSLTPPPTSTWEPAEFVIVLPVTKEAARLKTRMPFPLLARVLLEMITFDWVAAWVEPSNTPTFWLLVKVLLSITTPLKMGPESN